MPGARPGARPGPPRVFHGWIVVTGAFLILFMAYGTQYAFGVFFAALIEEFGCGSVVENRRHDDHHGPLLRFSVKRRSDPGGRHSVLR